jgi:hypothetical protein
MEFNVTSDESDRDKKMKESFESDDDSEDAKDKPRRRNLASIIAEAAEKHERDRETPKNKPEKKLETSLLSPEISSDAFIDTLEPAERDHIETELIHDKADEALETLHNQPDGSVAAAEATATATHMAALEARIAQGLSLEEAFEPAAQDTLAALDLPAEALEDDIEAGNPETETIETDFAAEADPTADDDAEVLTPPTPPTRRATPPLPPIPPVPPTPPRSPLPPGGGSYPPGGAWPPGGPGGPGGPSAIGGDRIVTVTETVEVPTRRRRRAELIVVGLGAYLIGRRRGRINTEARLVPVQEKLQREVSQLEQQIDQRDQKLRRLAAKQAETTRTPEKMRQVSDRLRQSSIDQRTETAAFKPERMGALLIEKPAAPTERNLTDAQVIEAAASIKLEGVSLKAMFDAGRLDMPGLRRAVFESNQGHSVEQLLPKLLIGTEQRQATSVEKQPVSAAGFDPGSSAAWQPMQTPTMPISNVAIAAKNASVSTSMPSNPATNVPAPQLPAKTKTGPNPTVLVFVAVAVILISGIIWLVVK